MVLICETFLTVKGWIELLFLTFYICYYYCYDCYRLLLFCYWLCLFLETDVAPDDFLLKCANCSISRSFLLKFLLLKFRVDTNTELQWLLFEPALPKREACKESTAVVDIGIYLSCWESRTTILDCGLISDYLLLVVELGAYWKVLPPAAWPLSLTISLRCEADN